MMRPELSIIIVNWNGIEFLPDCLRTIIENPPSVPFEVIVVDNDSSDGSMEWLASGETKQLFPAGIFKLIKSGANLGFGRANNLAIEQTSTPFVLFLNPDTKIEPSAVDFLLETLKSEDKIGAVAPKLLNADGSLQANVWAFPPTPLYLLVTGLKLYKFLPNRFVRDWLYSIHWDYKRKVAVPAFSGAAFMVKREMMDDVGAFDDSIHMYGEDAEWCVRMNRNGWRTFFEPMSEIYHIGGQSAIQRWGNGDIRLKEEEAFISVQRKLLPKYCFVANQMSRLLVLLLLYCKNFIARRDTSGLGASIKLQIASFR